MLAFRIQDRKRGVEYLLNPETQYSWPMDYDEDYTLTYGQLVEMAEEWVEKNN